MSDYALKYYYTLLYEKIIEEARENKVDLEKEYEFGSMTFLTTEDERNGVIVSYKKNKNNSLIIFFIYELKGEDYFRVG